MAFSHSSLRLIYFALRCIQTLFSLTTLVLYATALSKHPQDPSAYIYAVTCSTITLLTLALYCIPKFPTRTLFLWDFVLAVLWAALAGVFGMVYLQGQTPEKEDEWLVDRTSMRGAVACELVVMVCWVLTAGWACTGYCRAALALRRLEKGRKETDKMLEGQERGVVDMDQDSNGDCEKGLMEGKGDKDWTAGKCAKA